MLQSPDADSTKAIRTEPAVSAASAQRPWRERVRHWLNGIGIVLLAVGAVSVALALTGALPRPTAQPDSWAEAVSPISQVHENGLWFVMEVTPGPYFTGEMLLVKLSLTNYSSTTYLLQGASVEGWAQACGGALYATINTGTGTQSFAPSLIGRCPFMETSLVPGGTITLQEFLPLIFGGKVSLEPDAQFLSSGTTSDGERTTGPGRDPLAGHWPSITLLVATTTPAARQITLRQAGSEVRISAPPLALRISTTPTSLPVRSRKEVQCTRVTVNGNPSRPQSCMSLPVPTLEISTRSGPIRWPHRDLPSPAPTWDDCGGTHPPASQRGEREPSGSSLQATTSHLVVG